MVDVVPVVNPIDQYVIVGIESTLTYNWQIDADTDIVVYKKSGVVITLMVLDTDYSVQSVGNPGGGTITFLPAQIPLVVGDIWTLYRATAVKRSTDFATSGAFLALSVNGQLDYLTRIVQDLTRARNISLSLDPALSEKLNPLIPAPIDGRPLVMKDLGSGQFEIIMGPVIP